MRAQGGPLDLGSRHQVSSILTTPTKFHLGVSQRQTSWPGTREPGVRVPPPRPLITKGVIYGFW